MKPGAIVTVKGFGNPVMTVSRLVNTVNGENPTDVECIWFDAGDNLHRGTFPVVILDYVDLPT